MDPVNAGASPGELDLRAYQGDDLAHRLEFEDDNGDPVDVTGWDVSAQVRRMPGGDLEVEFTVEQGDESHHLLISLSGAQTAALDEGPNAWDLQRIQDGATRTLLRGQLLVTPQVTEG